MKAINIFIILGLFFMLLLGVSIVYAQQPTKDGGAFSAYLIGTYEQRAGVATMFHIINPTNQDGLEVVMAFYDDKEEYKACLKFTLSANDMEEVIVPFRLKGLPQFGVVKIISHKGGQATRGIVGFQRQVLLSLNGNITIKSFSESLLASVPTEVAEIELPILLERCK